MFETLKENFAVVGLLRRLLVRLSSIDKALTSLADSQSLLLKLQVLQAGGSVEELRSEASPGATGSPMDDDVDYTDEEYAEQERIEQDMRSRGSVPADDADLGALKRALLHLEKEKDQ